MTPEELDKYLSEISKELVGKCLYFSKLKNGQIISCVSKYYIGEKVWFVALKEKDNRIDEHPFSERSEPKVTRNYCYEGTVRFIHPSLDSNIFGSWNIMEYDIEITRKQGYLPDWQPGTNLCWFRKPESLVFRTREEAETELASLKCTCFYGPKKECDGECTYPGA